MAGGLQARIDQSLVCTDWKKSWQTIGRGCAVLVIGQFVPVCLLSYFYPKFWLFNFIGSNDTAAAGNWGISCKFDYVVKKTSYKGNCDRYLFTCKDQPNTGSVRHCWTIWPHKGNERKEYLCYKILSSPWPDFGKGLVSLTWTRALCKGLARREELGLDWLVCCAAEIGAIS